MSRNVLIVVLPFQSCVACGAFTACFQYVYSMFAVYVFTVYVNSIPPPRTPAAPPHWNECSPSPGLLMPVYLCHLAGGVNPKHRLNTKSLCIKPRQGPSPWQGFFVNTDKMELFGRRLKIEL